MIRAPTARPGQLPIPRERRSVIPIDGSVATQLPVASATNGRASEPATTPENLGIKLSLNGELRQDSNISNHLSSVAEQISYLSGMLELYPGDILLTGTPAGVGMETGTFLKPGDVMKVWIAGLGKLETTLA